MVNWFDDFYFMRNKILKKWLEKCLHEWFRFEFLSDNNNFVYDETQPFENT